MYVEWDCLHYSSLPTATHPRLLRFQIALVNLYLSFIECEFILQPTPQLMPFAAWKAEADELFV